MTAVKYERKYYYRGSKASDYEASRIGRNAPPLSRFRWNIEQKAMRVIAESLASPATVLDIPCGTGRYFPIFAEAGHRIIGADISRDMLATIPEGRRVRSVSALQADIARIPLGDQAVDHIIAMRVWSFLPDSVRRSALEEWRRVARQSTFVQVRFNGELAYDGIDAIKIESDEHFPTQSETIAPEQSAKWPTFHSFSSMVEAAGLMICKIYSLDWGSDFGPVAICELTAK